MNTLDYIYQRFQIDQTLKSPIELSRSREGVLTTLINNLDFKVGAEIGVAEGLFSEFLCKHCLNLKLYSVDAWENYEAYGDYVGIPLQKKYEEARIRLAPYNIQFVRDYSMNAVKRVKDESLDFVYIDAAHDYKSVKEDITEWSKKVRKDGIVAGHDYMDPNPDIINKLTKKNLYRADIYGVKAAVNDWVKENNIDSLFILTKVNCRSWFYVKT